MSKVGYKIIIIMICIAVSIAVGVTIQGLKESNKIFALFEKQCFQHGGNKVESAGEEDKYQCLKIEVVDIVKNEK